MLDKWSSLELLLASHDVQDCAVTSNVSVLSSFGQTTEIISGIVQQLAGEARLDSNGEYRPKTQDSVFKLTITLARTLSLLFGKHIASFRPTFDAVVQFCYVILSQYNQAQQSISKDYHLLKQSDDAEAVSSMWRVWTLIVVRTVLELQQSALQQGSQRRVYDLVQSKLLEPLLLVRFGADQLVAAVSDDTVPQTHGTWASSIALLRSVVDTINGCLCEILYQPEHLPLYASAGSSVATVSAAGVANDDSSVARQDDGSAGSDVDDDSDKKSTPATSERGTSVESKDTGVKLPDNNDRVSYQRKLFTHLQGMIRQRSIGGASAHLRGAAALHVLPTLLEGYLTACRRHLHPAISAGSAADSGTQSHQQTQSKDDDESTGDSLVGRTHVAWHKLILTNLRCCSPDSERTTQVARCS